MERLPELRKATDLNAGGISRLTTSDHYRCRHVLSLRGAARSPCSPSPFQGGVFSCICVANSVIPQLCSPTHAQSSSHVLLVSNIQLIIGSQLLSGGRLNDNVAAGVRVCPLDHAHVTAAFTSQSLAEMLSAGKFCAVAIRRYSDPLIISLGEDVIGWEPNISRLERATVCLVILN